CWCMPPGRTSPPQPGKASYVASVPHPVRPSPAFRTHGAARWFRQGPGNVEPCRKGDVRNEPVTHPRIVGRNGYLATLPRPWEERPGVLTMQRATVRSFVGWAACGGW